jgi:chromosome segregation ATPase
LFGDNFSFPGVPTQGELNNTVVKAFLESMADKVAQLREQLRSEKDETQQKETEYQTRINQLRHSLATQEGTDKMKRRLLGENQQKLRQISADLRTIEASSSKLQNIEQDLRTAERDLEQARQDDKSADFTAQINQLKRDKRELDEQSRRLSDELQAINMQASARGALEALRKERNVKEDAIKELESHRGEEFQRLCRKSTEMEDSLLFLQGQIREKQVGLRRITDRVKQTASELTSKKTEIRIRQNECSEKEKQIKKLEDSICAVCPDFNIQAALKKIEDKIKEREESIEIFGQAELLFKKYQNRLAKTHQCPLCERDIGDKLQWLTDKMTNAIAKAPSSRNSSKKDLEELKGKQKTLLDALRSEETMISLKNEVSEVKQKISSIERVVADLTSREEELRDEEASLTAEETALRELEPDLRLLEQHRKELLEVQEKVRRQEAAISGGTSRTAQAVSAELQECQMKSEQISHQIESKQTWIVKCQQTISQLERQVNEHKSEKLQLEAKLQQRSRLVEQKIELTTANERLELEVQECNRNICPLQASLQETEKEKAQFITSRNEAEEMMRVQADRLEQETRSLQRKDKALLM